jgi:DNA-binding LacI/PurR family transcriptional regulator
MGDPSSVRGIKALARHLDLSIGTVSRALNDRPDVNAKTRERVLAAAEELGYVANQSGRSLRQGTTNAIGFMIELNADTGASGDDFFMRVFEGVSDALSPHGLDLVVLPCSPKKDPASYLRRIVGRRLVDGVILSATQRFDDRIKFLLASDVPFIALGRSETPGTYPWIDLDFEGYVDTSIDRLVSFGHTRIALAMPATGINLGSVLLERYKTALARHGLPFKPEYVFPIPSSEKGGYELVDRMFTLGDRPTAVILSYELMAFGIYHRLNELNLRPGYDLAIIGLRESPQSRSLRPLLTCYHTPLVKLGRELGAALVDVMPNFAPTPPGEPKHKLWPLELVPGESDMLEPGR